MYNSMNKKNFLTNTYEQQIQIETRLNQLFKCLKLADDLRSDIESSKKNLKSNLNRNFDEIRTNMNNLERNMIKKIDQEIIKNQLEKPIRNLENDINQLIGNLNSLSMLNDSEKLLCLKNIDSSIKKIENSFNLIKQYKSNEIDNFDLNRHEIIKNKINKINKIVNDENFSLNSETFSIENDQNLEYKKWLLKPNNNSLNNELNAFEFVDINQEPIDMITDFDDIEAKIIELNDDSNDLSISNQFNVQNRFEKKFKNDYVTPVFNHIYSKPIDYWLLRSDKSTEYS